MGGQFYKNTLKSCNVELELASHRPSRCISRLVPILYLLFKGDERLRGMLGRPQKVRTSLDAMRYPFQERLGTSLGVSVQHWPFRQQFLGHAQLLSTSPKMLSPPAQSTIQKKKAAVHFTTIPCEPNIANRQHRKPYFGKIHPCTNKIVYARFDVFKPFLCVFMSGFRIFVRYELLVNVPVAIFFRTVDCFIYCFIQANHHRGIAKAIPDQIIRIKERFAHLFFFLKICFPDFKRENLIC